MALHGLPTNSFMFRALIPSPAESIHLIALTTWGFGLSNPPSAEEFG
jgi:hypothetical protein